MKFGLRWSEEHGREEPAAGHSGPAVGVLHLTHGTCVLSPWGPGQVPRALHGPSAAPLASTPRSVPLRMCSWSPVTGLHEGWPGGDRACVWIRSPCEVFTLPSSMARPVTVGPGAPPGVGFECDAARRSPQRHVFTQLCLQCVYSQVMSDEAGPMRAGTPGAGAARVGSRLRRLEPPWKTCISGEIQKHKASVAKLERRFKAEW